MTVADVLRVLQNGDTAAKVAERLYEAAGRNSRHAPTRVVPLLNQAREEGLVERSTPDRNGAPCAVARWSFA